MKNMEPGSQHSILACWGRNTEKDMDPEVLLRAPDPLLTAWVSWESCLFRVAVSFSREWGVMIQLARWIFDRIKWHNRFRTAKIFCKLELCKCYLIIITMIIMINLHSCWCQRNIRFIWMAIPTLSIQDFTVLQRTLISTLSCYIILCL